jgi:hypothetical protein
VALAALAAVREAPARAAPVRARVGQAALLAPEAPVARAAAREVLAGLAGQAGPWVRSDRSATRSSSPTPCASSPT